MCLGSEALRDQLREALKRAPIRVCCGPDGLDELATLPEADRIVISVAGTPGLSPTLSAIEAGKDVAIASKEVLVAAGHLVMEAAGRNKVALLPIDSEHSAIFQCVNGEDRAMHRKDLSDRVRRSVPRHAKVRAGECHGRAGPRPPDLEDGQKGHCRLGDSYEQGTRDHRGQVALRGRRRKRLKWCFIPKSIVHSLVRFCDGSIIAQLGLPDMRLPIQYALLYPERVDTALPRLDLLEAGPLTFDRVDLDKFECLSLAMEAARVGGTLGGDDECRRRGRRRFVPAGQDRVFST